MENNSEVLDLAKINVDVFCDLNGVDDNNRALMNKMFGSKIDSYDNWHDELSKEFKLHDKKDFSTKNKKQVNNGANN